MARKGFSSGSGNLGKLGTATQAHHATMMNSFEKVASPKPGNMGGQVFEHSSAGLPRSAAQMSSVKKAAAKSAIVRGERAALSPTSKASAAPTTGPRPPNPALQGEAPGLSTGGVSLAKQNKKGLLSL